MEISFKQIPYLCEGVVLSVEEDNIVSVHLNSTPIGPFTGPVDCTPLASPSSDNNYRVGSKVKVFAMFIHGGAEDKWLDIAPRTSFVIVGEIEQRGYTGLKIENPLLPRDSVRYMNKYSTSGMAIDDNGNITVATNSNVYSLMNPGGSGVLEDSFSEYAQNFSRVISNNAPYFIARQHFGMSMGETDADVLANAANPTACLITKRSFVPQSKMADSWVSTCEGNYTPYFGPNNTSLELSSVKDTLYYKAINNGTSRITIDAGELGATFFQLRVDTVIMPERFSVTPAGVTPALLGNKFNFSVSEKGDFEVSNGAGIPGANLNGVKISATADGELRIMAKKGITLTTGDSEDKLNSIHIGDSKVEISAVGGMTVNGEEVLFKRFVDWFVANSALLFVAPPSGPCTPGPGIKLMMDMNKVPTTGFPTNGIPVPAPGVIVTKDEYTSV